MFLINGVEQTQIAASDRGLQFGDGCFTTARVINGEVRMLAQHLARLRLDCQRLMLPEPDWATLEQEMCDCARAQPRAVLKVIITRGAGGRGYSPAACCHPTRIIRIAPWPDAYQRWREQGVTLALSPIRLGRNPQLAGIKHLNRLEQVLIRTQLEQTHADEALVLDSDGWLTECCAANLFWRKGKQVFTPRLDAAGVNGTMRQRIIALLADSAWRVDEAQIAFSALQQADEVLICNALLPVAPVRQVESWCYSSRELYQFLAPQCE